MLAELAPIQPLPGIVQQVPAIFAECVVRTMIAPAVDVDHIPDYFLLAGNHWSLHPRLSSFAPMLSKCVNANVILHNSGEEKMHDSGEKSLWVRFKQGVCNLLFLLHEFFAFF